MTQRIAPSERIEQEMKAFLHSGINSSEQPVSEFIQLETRQIVQQALDQ